MHLRRSGKGEFISPQIFLETHEALKKKKKTQTAQGVSGNMAPHNHGSEERAYEQIRRRAGKSFGKNGEAAA
jgi:hypothetical protein